MKIKKRGFSQYILSLSFFFFYPLYYYQLSPILDIEGLSVWHVIIGFTVFLNAVLFFRSNHLAIPFFAIHAVSVLVLNFILLFKTGNVVFAFLSLLESIVFYAWYTWMNRRIRAPFFIPRVKWWESRPKSLPNLAAWVISGSREIPCHVVTLSEEGCFLYIDGKHDEKLDDRVEIRLNFMSRECKSEGNVITHLDSKGGWGIQFNGISLDKRRELGEFVNEMRRKGYVEYA